MKNGSSWICNGKAAAIKKYIYKCILPKEQNLGEILPNFVKTILPS
jgi:hypothetical protein